ERPGRRAGAVVIARVVDGHVHQLVVGGPELVGGGGQAVDRRARHVLYCDRLRRGRLVAGGIGSGPGDRRAAEGGDGRGIVGDTARATIVAGRWRAERDAAGAALAGVGADRHRSRAGEGRLLAVRHRDPLSTGGLAGGIGGGPGDRGGPDRIRVRERLAVTAAAVDGDGAPVNRGGGGGRVDRGGALARIRAGANVRRGGDGRFLGIRPGDGDRLGARGLAACGVGRGPDDRGGARRIEVGERLPVAADALDGDGDPRTGLAGG